VLQNPSKYKIRPGPPNKALKGNSSDDNLSSILTKGFSKHNTDATTSDVGSPCYEKAIESSGMERAYTFAVEEGASGWNLLENNQRLDPIPPEPVALNEARLLCREAMTLITEEVSC